MIKKVAIMLALTLALCSGCRSYYLVAECTEPDDYLSGTILLERYGYHHEKNNNRANQLLPLSENDYEITSFYCKCFAMFPIGETIQFFAEFQYKYYESYEKEIERIAQIEYEKEIVFDTNIFYLPSYITLLSHKGCSEYLLVESESLTLRYVYIQFVNANELSIPDEFLPKVLNNSNAIYDGDITETEICIYHD